MKAFLYILIILLASCNTKKAVFFESLQGKIDIEISLKDYKLDSIPSEIGLLKSAQRLYINRDTAIKGWTSYPPLSALGDDIYKPPFRSLPNEITELTNLKSLTLANLNLVTLPDDIGRLKNLDSFSLIMNKLTISNEVNKIKKLQHLKYLNLIGNHTTQDDLFELKKSIRGIHIWAD